MGKTRRFFRQSNKSLSGNQGARNYSQVQRSEPWQARLINLIKVRGKSNGAS